MSPHSSPRTRPAHTRDPWFTCGDGFSLLSFSTTPVRGIYSLHTNALGGHSKPLCAQCMCITSMCPDWSHSPGFHTLVLVWCAVNTHSACTGLHVTEHARTSFEKRPKALVPRSGCYLTVPPRAPACAPRAICVIPSNQVTPAVANGGATDPVRAPCARCANSWPMVSTRGTGIMVRLAPAAEDQDNPKCGNVLARGTGGETKYRTPCTCRAQTVLA